MSAAIGVAAPEFIAAGPLGWVALGLLTAIPVGVSLWNMFNKAHEEAKDEKTDDVATCPGDGSSTGGPPPEEKPPSQKPPPGKPPQYPKNPDDLLKQGYREISDPRASAQGIRRFENPKTGDTVEFHSGKTGESGWEGKDHYHRFNPNSTGRGDLYLDKSGSPVRKGSSPSHLEPGE